MPTDPLTTHDVTNQPPPLTGYDVFGIDRTLTDAVTRGGRVVGRGRAARARPQGGFVSRPAVG